MDGLMEVSFDATQYNYGVKCKWQIVSNGTCVCRHSNALLTIFAYISPHVCIVQPNSICMTVTYIYTEDKESQGIQWNIHTYLFFAWTWFLSLSSNICFHSVYLMCKTFSLQIKMLTIIICQIKLTPIFGEQIVYLYFTWLLKNTLSIIWVLWFMWPCVTVSCPILMASKIVSLLIPMSP